VIADERRHMKYARAISRRHAPDEATLERTLRQVRAAEERAYLANVEAFTRIAVAQDLLEVSNIERIFWKGIVSLGQARARRVNEGTVAQEQMFA
jgi:hypothetical protein